MRYPNYPQADYTLKALEGQFSIAETAKVTFPEYTGRIVATRRMYRVMSGIGNTDSLHILSFRKVESDDPTLVEAQAATGQQLAGPAYRYDVFDDDATPVDSGDVTLDDFDVGVMYTLLIGSGDFLFAYGRIGDGSQRRTAWQVLNA